MRGKVMEYYRLDKRQKNGDFPLGEYKHCVVQTLCSTNRIPSAIKIGSYWRFQLTRKNKRTKE